MLQRAASNAYSWWWASQIRTKQSKWLDNNLQEMEEKVKTMIKLIDEDADTFAKKAELYFRRRPELISFVEEMFRAYKALADRCDRISGELHKANHTIATAFPDQVQLELEEDDDDGVPKAITSVDPSKLRKQTTGKHQFTLINKNKEECTDRKRTHHRRISSHISKDKAQEEIERLQKEILVLQTEKEFVKSSYENGVAKYWNIEKQITEMQEEVSNLQDAFSASAIIEDDEARALMAATAIKSCEDSLVSLHEQHKITTEETRVESERIKDAKELLKALKVECGQSDTETSEISDEDMQSSSTKAEEEICGLKEERLELKTICQKVKEHFEMSSETSVVELAEKIDELVDKVIMLELTVASQTSQINTLRTETDELQKNLRGLEEDKMTLIDDSNTLTERLKQAEEELQRVQLLEKSVQDEKGIIQTHLAEACDNFNDLSEKLQSPKYHEQVAEARVSSKETIGENEFSKGAIPEEVATEQSEPSMSSQQHSQVDDLDDVSDLQLLMLNGKEGSDNNLSPEYKSILCSYRDTKNRLSELEKKNQEQHLETMAQVKELKIANAMKDEEIRILRQILGSLQANPNAQEKSDAEKRQNSPSTVADGESSRADEGTKSRSSPVEEKFRTEIDNLLDENLDFWLRFSTSYHQIQRFQTTFMDLKVEMEKLDGKRSQESADVKIVAFAEEGKQDRAPVEKRLRELNTELQVWLEKNAMLKGELQCRFSSLCSIQDEISKAIESEDGQFTHYQAAKCQGEVLNMKLENNKVAKELQAGLDHVRGLQVEVGRALSKLREKSLQLTAARSHQHHGNLRHLSSKTRVPLRTFLFGAKPKKPSIFSCMSPAMQKQYSDIRRSQLPTQRR